MGFTTINQVSKLHLSFFHTNHPRYSKRQQTTDALSQAESIGMPVTFKTEEIAAAQLNNDELQIILWSESSLCLDGEMAI